MSHSGRSTFRKLKRVALKPYHALVDILSSLRDALYLLPIFGHKRRRHRRNRDFEKAGRERSHVRVVDAEAAANLNKADRIRDQEIINQVKRENRLLRRNNNESKLLKQEMEEESLSFSQGAAINHLAEVNRKAAEKRKKEQQVPNEEKQQIDD